LSEKRRHGVQAGKNETPGTKENSEDADRLTVTGKRRPVALPVPGFSLFAGEANKLTPEKKDCILKRNEQE
jgi:hypothetical protein